MSLKIPLLQRYILFETLKVFFFVLTSITVLLVFVGVFQQAADRGLTFRHAVPILPYVIPSLLPFTIPAAMLLTVSIVFGRMSGDQEIVAAKSAGIHPVSLMWPTLYLSALLSGASYFLADQMIPWSITQIEHYTLSVMEDLFLERLRSELHFSDRTKGLHIHVFAVDGPRLIHPVIRYAKSERIITMQAEEAILQLDHSSQEIVVRLLNGFIEFPGDSRAYFQGERTERIRWTSEEDRRKVYHLPVTSIRQEIGEIQGDREQEQQLEAIEVCLALSLANFEKLIDVSARHSTEQKSDEFRLYKLQTEVHSRYAMACSCFFFVLLGTPIAILYGKTQFATSFLFCFMPIVCGYYPLTLGLMSQAKHGTVGPEWAMWVANAGVLACAWIALRKVIRY